ncbi:MAG TPA: hypothetical protein VJ259_06500 [Actinomycetota bacterium]|nr:hypothetical protein [Actinomycetota bacterium]
MAQRGQSFDMSKLTTATKIILGGSILLLIDSFLAWQKVCAGIEGIAEFCVSASMWGGDGAIFGVIAGLLTIAVIVWEVLALAGTNLNVGMPASKLSAYLGFGVVGFTVLKFIFALTESPSFGAYVGLILALVVGYGAWMRFQEPSGGTSAASPGGFTS